MRSLRSPVPTWTLYKLEAILNGDMDELVNALITAKQSELLQQMQ